MDRENRLKLIDDIGEAFKGPVIVYITGDRGPNLQTRIATDIFPMFHKHLMQIGEKNECINLFIYSTGGVTIAGYGLVNLFKEFCTNFQVIIPFKALSSATLISLGANNIFMTSIGQLSPIDPSIEHPLGPQVQVPGAQFNQLAPINIEDVNGFIELAKEEFELKGEESSRKIFEILTSRIHPLALGTVQRTRTQIEFLAETLMKDNYDKNQINEIKHALIRGRFSHDYIINRKEAKDILKLKITDPNDVQNKLIMDLYNEYNNLLELNVPYNQEAFLNGEQSNIQTFDRGIIESTNLTHVFRTKKEFNRISSSPNINERIIEDGWIQDDEI